MISNVISAWSATWSVHDQSRDHCMISHVISARAVTWSVHDQPRDHCMIAMWSLPTVTWSVHGSQVISARYPSDHRMINNMISNIQTLITVCSVTWSVSDQPRDQCMISFGSRVWSATWSVHDSHVISAWSVTSSVHDQSRDQCMISYVISAG